MARTRSRAVRASISALTSARDRGGSAGRARKLAWLGCAGRGLMRADARWAAGAWPWSGAVASQSLSTRRRPSGSKSDYGAVAYSRETRPGVSNQLGEDVPSETAQAWHSARRVREPIAWALLVVAAIAVLVSAWQLFGLPGDGLPGGPVATAASPAPVTSGPSPSPVATAPSPAPVATAPSPVAVTTFGWRASAVAPQFVAGGIFTLPVLSVILVAFAGGLTGRARQVVQTAVSILAVALGLGVVSWLGALGAHSRPGV